MLLKISQNLQEHICAGDSGTSVFQWTLRNFLEHLLSRTTSNGFILNEISKFFERSGQTTCNGAWYVPCTEPV